MVVQAQRPYLKKYVVNLRWEHDTLPGKPTGESDWDGCAELWFETEADFNAVYGWTTVSPTRADTLKHVSRFERLVVQSPRAGPLLRHHDQTTHLVSPVRGW